MDDGGPSIKESKMKKLVLTLAALSLLGVACSREDSGMNPATDDVQREQDIGTGMSDETDIGTGTMDDPALGTEDGTGAMDTDRGLYDEGSDIGTGAPESNMNVDESRDVQREEDMGSSDAAGMGMDE